MPMTCLIVSGWLSTASSPPAITPANHSSRRICLGEPLAPAKAPLLSLDRHVRCRASEDEQPGHHWPAGLPAPRPYESLVNRLQGEPGCFFVFRSGVIGEGPRPSVITPACRRGLADQPLCGHVGPAWRRCSAICQAKDRQKRGSFLSTAP